jgi:hypothetical protein
VADYSDRRVITFCFSLVLFHAIFIPRLVRAAEYTYQSIRRGMSELYTVEAPSGPPSLADAAARLHLAVAELDPNFGVILIDPARHLYAVSKLTDGGGHGHAPSSGVGGPFANPKIESFGLP